MKKRNMLAIIIFIFLVNASLALANPVGDFIDNLQEGQTGLSIYDENKEVVDFFLFFSLFLAITFLSLSNFFQGEGQRNPLMVISFVIAASFAIAAMKAGLSPSKLSPFAGYIFLLLGTLGLWYLFNWAANVQSVEGRLFSLLIAALIAWLMIVAIDGSLFEGSTRIPGSDTLSRIVDKATSASEEEVKPVPLSSEATDTAAVPLPADTTETTGDGEDESGDSSLLYWIAIPLLVVLFIVLFVVRRFRGGGDETIDPNNFEENFQVIANLVNNPNEIENIENIALLNER